jgi:hypothetical protein
MATSTERVRAMRARRAAALEADPAAALRDADELLGPAVAASLAALDLAPEHAAVARLAERYASSIDAARDPAWAARWIGPLLLDCLEQLGATPMSRPKQRPVPAGPSKLDQLRSVRRQTFPGA